MVYTEVGLIIEADKNVIDAFDKLRKKRLQWIRQAEVLSQIDADFTNNPFFNCWFLSVPQLLVVLQYCNGNEDFQKVMYSTRHITMGTHNFYAEFYHSFIKNNNPV